MVELVTLAAIGYAIAFLVVSEWIAWLRDPIRNRLILGADRVWGAAQSEEWKPKHLAQLVAAKVLGLLAYLLDCRRCLAVEAVLIWSLATGWPGWDVALAAAGIAVFAFELWTKPS